jgi:hypothetical protein
MHVAEVVITLGSFSGACVSHRVPFTDLEKASAEYTRLSDIAIRRRKREDGVQSMVEVVGDGLKMECPIDYIMSIILYDYVEIDKHQHGVIDNFPGINPGRMR